MQCGLCPPCLDLLIPQWWRPEWSERLKEAHLELKKDICFQRGTEEAVVRRPTISYKAWEECQGKCTELPVFAGIRQWAACGKERLFSRGYSVHEGHYHVQTSALRQAEVKLLLFVDCMGLAESFRLLGAWELDYPIIWQSYCSCCLSRHEDIQSWEHGVMWALT